MKYPTTDDDQLTSAEFVQPMSEIQKVITNSSIGLSGADVSQLVKALSSLIPSVAFLSDTAVWPTKALTTVPPYQPIESLVNGMLLRFRCTEAVSPSGAFINVDGLGSKSIVYMDGSSLRSGDIINDIDAVIRYDGSLDKWLLVNPQNPKSDVSYIEGLIHKNDVANLTTHITVESGSCSPSGGELDLILPTPTTKDITAVWSNATTGMAPTGVNVLTGSHYHYRLFVIGGPIVDTSWGIDTPDNDMAFDLRATAGVGYTQYRQIGWISMETAGSATGPPFTGIVRYVIDEVRPETVVFDFWGLYQEYSGWSTTVTTAVNQTYEEWVPPNVTVDFDIWPHTKYDPDVFFNIVPTSFEDTAPTLLSCTMVGRHLATNDAAPPDGRSTSNLRTQLSIPVDDSSSISIRASRVADRSNGFQEERLDMFPKSYTYKR